MKTEEEDSYAQAKERGLEHIPSAQPSEGINPTNILISDMQPSELWQDEFLLFKPAGLWYLNGSSSKWI